MISDDSPFRALARDIPTRQILYLDGLRLSAEMAWESYESLHSMLIALSLEESGEIGHRATQALNHAYSVVDSVHRFRGLLRATPRIKHNQVYEVFMRGTKEVLGLRNIVQHLNNHVDSIAENGLAALGTLTWLGTSAALNGPPTAWILQPGTFYRSQFTYGPVIDLESVMPEDKIADVSLMTSGKTVNLSTTIDRLRVVVKSLELALQAHCEGKQRFGSDVKMQFQLIPVPDTDQ